MYSELVDLGQTLENTRQLPPAGFASYREPIKWLVRLWSDHADLEAVDVALARPFSGRTSGIEAHLLVDEASYVLGIASRNDGSVDRQARAKHEEEFRPLYQRFRDCSVLTDPALGEAIDWLDEALEHGWLNDDPLWTEVRAKDWVSVRVEEGPLAGTHLFAHEDAQAYWVDEMERRCTRADGDSDENLVIGECAICSEVRPLVRKLPLKVKLAVAAPMHSLNASAFTSYMAGPTPEKRSHLGMCFRCGEVSARTFNFLGESGENRLHIVRQPRSPDALGNQYAVFWNQAPGPVMAGDREVDLTSNDGRALAVVLEPIPRLPVATLDQMTDLLRIPWVPTNPAFSLEDFAFHLALLSPNVGRVAIREWLVLPIEPTRRALLAWLDQTSMYHLYREMFSPISIPTLMEALGDTSAEMTRALISTAYGKAPPPRGLLTLAGRRLNRLNAVEPMLRARRHGGEFWDNDWPHALAGAIRLVRSAEHGGDAYMDTVNPALNSAAYHCGRLLAVLEGAQQAYAFQHPNDRFEFSIAQRGYGGAVASPQAVLGRMFRIANAVHLPGAGVFLNEEVEAIVQRLEKLGGTPKRLNAEQQTDFGLGFLQERGLIRQYWKEIGPLEQHVNADFAAMAGVN